MYIIVCLKSQGEEKILEDYLPSRLLLSSVTLLCNWCVTLTFRSYIGPKQLLVQSSIGLSLVTSLTVTSSRLYVGFKLLNRHSVPSW